MSERLRADARALPILALAVLVYGLAFHENATLVQAGTYGAIYAIAAIGLSMLLGNVAQISIGQAGFFGVGAYTLAYVTTNAHWNFVPAALLGTALAAALGLAVGVVALRFRGHYLAMATLAFGLIVVGVFHQSAALGGANGISDVPFPQFGALTISGLAAYWFSWAMVALVAVVSLNVLRGRTGRAFEALRNDELAAEVAGVPTRRTKILAFAFAGALAGFAGSIDAGYLGLVTPDTVGVQLSIDLLLMVVLGGVGGVSGAIFGAALISIVNLYGHDLENWRFVIYGVLVIVVVTLFPGGIVGSLGRIAARRRGSREAPPIEQQSRAPAAPAPGRAADAGAAPIEWLRVRDLVMRFGGLVAVDGVSFALEPGRLTSLIGPNGAGKTTVFNAICGIGRVASGSIAIAGRDVTGWQPHRIAGLGVARSFQNARLFAEMTVLENVMAGAYRLEDTSFVADLLALPAARRGERVARERAREMLRLLDLERIAAVPAKELAFGDRRRVELARALASEPGLLLIDEPAAGLGASERARLRDDLLGLRARGMTLLLIEHDMRLVMEISDRVMVLRFGTLIADGLPAAVRADPHVQAAYLGAAG